MEFLGCGPISPFGVDCAVHQDNLHYGPETPIRLGFQQMEHIAYYELALHNVPRATYLQAGDDSHLPVVPAGNL